jgi:hypothetical protein
VALFLLLLPGVACREDDDEITDEEVLAQACAVCRDVLDEGDEPGPGICSTCLRNDAEEREADPATTERIHEEADRDSGIDAKDGLL